MDIVALGQALTALKTVFDLLRAAKDSLPSSEAQQKAEAALQDAERQLRIVEAEAAKSLGYPICKCAWPPNIMLFDKAGLYRCGACGHELPAYQARRLISRGLS